MYGHNVRDAQVPFLTIIDLHGLDYPSSEYPTELYGLIFKFIDDTPTLLSLLVTSRTIKAEAERVLYHAVALSEPFFIKRAIKFFETVSNCDRLARLVHRLAISWEQYSLPEAIRIRTHMVPALHALVNLKSLICTAPFSNPPRFRDFKFQLKEFVWNDIWDESDFTAFLTNQPHLQHLKVHYRGDTLQLPPSACKKLSVLSINAHHVSAFLHSANIEYLEWRDCKMHSSSILDAAESLHSVRALVLKDALSGDVLETLAPYLPELEYLAVKDTDHAVLGHYLALSSLRGLALMSNDFHGEAEASPQSVDMAKMLMSAMPHLRFVELGPPWPYLPLYRLERGEPLLRVAWPRHDWLAAIS